MTSKKRFLPVICLFAAGVCRGQALSSLACRSVSFGGSLAQGQELNKDIGGGLLLRVWPTPLGKVVRNEGWFIDLVSHDRPIEEYLNWVNTPLRESNSRVLGPERNIDTHGRNTAEQSLGHPREMRFLLTKDDYDHVSAAYEKAEFLEGSSEVLEEAQRKYQIFLNLINTVPTGRLNLLILSYKVDPNTGFPMRIRFRARLTAPSTFKFAGNLKPSPTQCSSSR
jgi:hypothetical protein